MKLRKIFLAFSLLGLLLMVACGSDDDATLNSEADIISATIPDADDWLQTDPAITNSKVSFRLKVNPEEYLFAPEFELSAGASIDPENGTECDFSQPQLYEVTSEDGAYSKTYTVSFIYDGDEDAEQTRTFSFENVSEDEEGHYHEFYEVNSSGQAVYDWGSGNMGYSITLGITGGDLTPEAYPTYQVSDGFEGKAARMETLTTGELGASFGAPLAAGNLFIGEFAEVVFGDPRQGVHFGQPYNHSGAPVMLKGHFKYKKGADFEVNNEEDNQISEDGWNAYAILFEKSASENYLKGDFSWDDSRIVSYARLDDAQRVETDDWTEFEIPFEWVEGKSFEPEQEYMYTIVFSASQEGDIFNGAVGSVLYIDEVKLITE